MSFFFYGEGQAPDESSLTDMDKQILKAIKGYTEGEKKALLAFIVIKSGK